MESLPTWGKVYGSLTIVALLLPVAYAWTFTNDSGYGPFCANTMLFSCVSALFGLWVWGMVMLFSDGRWGRYQEDESGFGAEVCSTSLYYPFAVLAVFIPVGWCVLPIGCFMKKD